jgi:uncharacterized protein (TIGR03067 family)
MEGREMPWRILTVAVVGFMVAADAPDEKTKPPLDGLQGKWVLTAQEFNGQETKVQPQSVGDTSLIIHGNQVTTFNGPVKQEGSIRLSKPNRIDILDRTGAMLRGIYSLDDGVLRVCFTTTGDRPTGFTSRTAPLAIGSYKRSTPDDPELTPFSAEMRRLQGTWKVKVKKEDDEDEDHSLTWVIKGDGLTVETDGSTLPDKAIVVVNPKTQPGNIALMFPGYTVGGNYSLDDDVMTISRAVNGSQQMIVLKRVNP